MFQVPGPLHLEHPLFRTVELASASGSDFWIGSCRWTCERYRGSGIGAEKPRLEAARRRRPDAPRPVKAVGYPVLPAVYLAATGLICVSLLASDVTRAYSFAGLVLVVLGVPLTLLATGATGRRTGLDRRGRTPTSGAVWRVRMRPAFSSV